VFGSALSNSKFQTAAHFDPKAYKNMLNMSDSAHKTKHNNYLNSHMLSGSGGFTSIIQHNNNPLSISPLLTKSVSCFDPVQNYDLIFNGSNLTGNELSRPQPLKPLPGDIRLISKPTAPAADHQIKALAFSNGLSTPLNN
jgi:hypothetical protein